MEEIRSNGVKLALIINGSAKSQREKVDRFGLARLFDCILIEGECGYGKPNERVYTKALSVLNIDASDAWIVGDNWEWEVVAPQRLGIKGIWVNAQGESVPDHGEVHAFKVVRSLSDLLVTLV